MKIQPSKISTNKCHICKQVLTTWQLIKYKLTAAVVPDTEWLYVCEQCAADESVKMDIYKFYASRKWKF